MQLGYLREQRIDIKRLLNFTIGPDTLRRFQPQTAPHQRLRQGHEQVVELVLVLAAHLQRIAKTRCGNQPSGRTLALDQRVGKQRGRVYHPRHIAAGDALGLKQMTYAADHTAMRRVRGGEFLV